MSAILVSRKINIICRYKGAKWYNIKIKSNLIFLWWKPCWQLTALGVIQVWAQHRSRHKTLKWFLFSRSGKEALSDLNLWWMLLINVSISFQSLNKAAGSSTWLNSQRCIGMFCHFLSCAFRQDCFNYKK